MDCSPSSSPILHYLPEFGQIHVCSNSFIESVMLPSHLILCCPLLLLPSVFPSIRVFSSESGLHIRWPEHWSFSFSISSSNEYSGLISFRTGWLDLLEVQGTFSCLLQHHNFFYSSVLSLLNSPTLISLYDYWKNSFDYMYLCRQGDGSAF